MKITRTVAGMTLAISLTALVGCGSSGSAKSSGTTGTSGSKTTATSEGSTSGASSKFVDVCKKITAEEVSAIVGGVVSAEAIPGGGCTFPQEDLRAPTASFNPSSSDTANGGYEGAKSGLTASAKGDYKDLPGVGDKAFLVVGPSPGGSMPQGNGLVQVGPTLIQVSMHEGSDMSKDDVEALSKKLLEFAASKA